MMQKGTVRVGVDPIADLRTPNSAAVATEPTAASVYEGKPGTKKTEMARDVNAGLKPHRPMTMSSVGAPHASAMPMPMHEPKSVCTAHMGE